MLTTINHGDLLDDYSAQAEAEDLRGNLKIIVIPDKKSPGKLYEKCMDIEKKGFNIICPTLSEQESFLKRIGKIEHLIPYNSDNRRNVGYLMALEWGCDVLVSLDDDNYCLRDDTFKSFATVNQGQDSFMAVHSSNGWYNICEMLQLEPNYVVYPRGFPYHKRNQPFELNEHKKIGVVKMNAGLWLGSPDVDAVTWLAAPVEAISCKGESIILDQNTWSPINTQNTSLHRDLIVAYYYIRMGYPLAGFPIDRMGDIISGYLCQACVRHFGHYIRIGTPIALHKRNAHNPIYDLTQELAGILIMEDFTEWIHEVKLDGTSYQDTYLSLSEAIDDQVERFKGYIWTDSTRSFFHQMTYLMRQWVKACQTIEGQ